jgi:hypothetical protein
VAKEAGHWALVYCHRDSRVDIEAAARGLERLHHPPRMRNAPMRAWALSRLGKQLKVQSPDVVHCYSIGDLWPLAFLLRRFAPISLLYTMEGEYRMFYRNWWLKTLIQRLDSLLLTHLEMKDNAWGHLGFHPRKMSYLGVGEEGENSRGMLAAPESDGEWRLLVSFGGHEEEHEFVIPLLAALRSINAQTKGPRFKLICHNERSWQQCLITNELKAAIAEFKCLDDVELVDGGNIGELQKRSHMWIELPSRSTLEDVSIRALMNHCPVILPRHAHSMELVRELGPVGHTYHPGDARELRDKIGKMAKDYAHYGESLEKAQEKLNELHGVGRYRRELLSTYERVFLRRLRLSSKRATSDI